jgi:PKD repeat protein
VKLSFRQGIARYQTDVSSNPVFIQRSAGAGNFIDLIVSPDPTIIVFSHHEANYIVEESKSISSAWGPINNTQTTYLFWDINLLTGAVTRGTTLFPPMYTGTPPSSPIVDQHWYDTTENVMFVWNGSKWIEKIRVFAGYITSAAIIHPYRIGSQAGVLGDFEGGNIILDAYNKPLRQSDGTFVTSSTDLIISNNSAKKVKFETEVLNGMAAEPIPKFTLVQMRAGRQIVTGRSGDFMSRIAGIVTEDLYQSEVGYVIPDGLIRNEQWNFPSNKVNRPVFCGPNGEVTTAPPQTGVCQICGYVYDTDAIYMNIMAPIILDDIYSNLPPIIPPPPLSPIANFFTTTTTGNAPFSVTFTSTSLGSPTTLEWDFTNDGKVDASGPTATYVFQTAGIYNVRLRAINVFGQDDEIKTGYIVVTPSIEPGGFTNLGIKLGGPAQILRNGTFQISVTVSNDGHLTATNVARQIVIPDLKGEQILISVLPAGATSYRSGTRLIVDLPAIPTLPTGTVYGPIILSLTAPTNSGKLTVAAFVNSPEVDATIGDNNASITVEVKP